MYGVETRFKISFSLGLEGVPLYREIPATKNHLTPDNRHPENPHADDAGIFLK